MAIPKTTSLSPKFLFLAYLTCCLGLVASTQGVLSSYWNGDDWPNSQSPYWNLWRYGDDSVGRVWKSIVIAHESWLKGQGRFFPLNIAETSFVFHFFRSVQTFKIYQFVLLSISITLFVVLVWLLSRSHRLVILLLVSLSISVQFRRDFDPHLAFAALVPSALSKLFLASILLVLAVRSATSAKRWGLSILGSLTYFAALSTYELTLVLIVVPIMSVFVASRETRRTRHLLTPIFGALLPAIGYVILVFGILRPNANDMTSGLGQRYAIGFTRESILIFLSQSLAAFPLTTFDLQKDLFNPKTLGFGLLLGFLITLIFGYLLKQLVVRNDTHKERFASLIGLASLMVLVPGIPMAVRVGAAESARFKFVQPELTYLHILASELGAALLIAVLAVPTLRTTYGWSNAKSFLLLVPFFVIFTVSVSHNQAVSLETQNRKLNYETWKILHRDKVLFSTLQDGDAVVSQTYNDAYEVNAANFFARSGIRLRQMFPPSYLYTPEEIECDKLRTCDLVGPQDRMPQLLVNGLLPDSEATNDWVWQSVQPGALESLRVFAFDIYAVTPSTMVAFLVPFDDESGLEVASQNLQLALATRIIDGKSVDDIRPSLSGICLERVNSKVATYSRTYPMEISYWRLPLDAQEPIGYQSLNFGIC